MINEFKENRKTLENGLHAAKNTSGYTSVALSRNIDDDDAILAYVTHILGQCEALKKQKVQNNPYKNPPGFEERFKKGMQSG